MAKRRDDRERRGATGQTQTLTRQRLKRPPLYRVIFHNDDYTTQDFVVMALMRYFHKTHTEASTLMRQVHTQGKGIAGLYPLDIARTKQMQVESEARKYDMPLKLTIEADDDGQEEDE